MNPPLYSIICPFYNEQDNLKEIYFRLTQTMQKQGSPYEIIFVNDGSDNDCEVLLKTLICKDPLTRVINLPHGGQFIAIYQGVQAARGTFFIIIDSDLQNPPEEILKLIPYLSQNDLVQGIRQNRKDPLIKKNVGVLANTLRRIILGDHILDIGCTLKCFTRKVLGALIPREGMQRFFPAIVELQGFSVVQVPVMHEYRRHGKSNYGTLKRLLESLALLPLTFKTIRGAKWRIKQKSG
jgi:glycosyltransferase involved in cell wall biosynthesis